MTEADWLGTSDPAPLLRFVAYRLTDRPQLLFMAGCCRRVWDLLTDPRFRRVVELAEDVADGRATEEALTAASEEAPRPGRPILRTLVLEGGRFVQTSNPSGSSDPLPAWHWHAYHAVAVIAPRRYLPVAEACEATAAQAAGERVAEGHPLQEDLRRLSRVARPFDRQTDELLRKLRNEVWSAGQEEQIEVSRTERAAQAELVRCLIGNPFRPVAADPAWLTSTVVDLARGIYDERAFDRLPILADALQDAGCDSDVVLSHCRGGGAHARGCWVVDAVLGKA